MMLVDGNGRIMAHAQRERMGERPTYLKEGSLNAQIVKIGEDEYLVSSRKLSVKDWRLVMLTPYEDAVHKLKTIFQSVFVIQLIAYAVFLLLLILLIRTFTRPLVRLGKLAHTVQRGNLEVRSYIQGSDEIGRLGSSFDQMLDRIKQMIHEITMEQSRKRKAELAMLQAQINPHFLFNVLNSIRMKVHRKGDQESAEMLLSLSRLLRMTIGHEDESVTLHEEVSTLIDYVNLMNLRQKEKAQLHVDIAAEAMFAQVPRFCLQPFIENALIHGLRQQSGTISLSARQAAPRTLEIVLRDDGAGMDEETLRKLRSNLTMAGAFQEEADLTPKGLRFTGIGTANVYERLRLRFGEAFVLIIDSEEGAGTTITMRVPLQEAGDPHV